MIRMLIATVCASALIVGCTISRARQAEIRDTAGTVATLFGLPRPVGEGVAGLGIAIATAFAGHKHGRRCERRSRSVSIPLVGPALSAPSPTTDGGVPHG